METVWPFGGWLLFALQIGFWIGYFVGNRDGETMGAAQGRLEESMDRLEAKIIGREQPR
jgi:hypothetical protein